MLESYFEHESERREQGIPPLPLSPGQTEEVCKFMYHHLIGIEINEQYCEISRDRLRQGVL